MLNSKENYEIKYFDNRWCVFFKGHTKPIPNAHYGSKVEAEIGLDKELEYWNKRQEHNYV